MKRREPHPNSRDTTITRLNIAKAQQERVALQLEPFTSEEFAMHFVHHYESRHVRRAERLMKSR